MATRGQKRHVVTLENPGPPVSDGSGGFTESWTPLSPPTMRAEIKPATARDLERVVANAVESTASHLVTMDYHRGITTETRITFGTRVFTMDGVQNPEERNITLVLACTEVVT
jgi:SPP1 family predicted phage head-tail adaptor